MADPEAMLRRATDLPLRINRYDNDGGSISWQLQFVGGKANVLANISDDEDPRARADAELLALLWNNRVELVEHLRAKARQGE